MGWIARVLIIALGLLLYPHLRKKGDEVARDARVSADKRIDSTITKALAKQLNQPEADVSRAVQSPSQMPELHAALRAAVSSIVITFTAPTTGGDTESTVAIDWSNGQKTRITETWAWFDLPGEVREQIIRQGSPVSVPWSFHS